MKARLLVILAAVLVLTACAAAVAQTGNPVWVDQLIKKFESEKVGNPPQSIWRYEYQGQSVYYVPAQCCDMFSSLYDANGTVICAPDGGLTGRGDGHCPDFYSHRSKEQLIWKDPRTR